MKDQTHLVLDKYTKNEDTNMCEFIPVPVPPIGCNGIEFFSRDLFYRANFHIPYFIPQEQRREAPVNQKKNSSSEEEIINSFNLSNND